MDTELIDKLFLELPQFATVKTKKEIALCDEVVKLKKQVTDMKDAARNAVNVIGKNKFGSKNFTSPDPFSDDDEDDD